MEKVIKFLGVIFVVLFITTQIKSCVNCWEVGGVPVQGVFTYACVK